MAETQFDGFLMNLPSLSDDLKDDLGECDFSSLSVAFASLYHHSGWPFTECYFFQISDQQKALYRKGKRPGVLHPEALMPTPP